MCGHNNNEKIDDADAQITLIPTTSTEMCTRKDDLVIHFVADNVDHNVRTLGSLNTFHGMGIISTTVCPNGDFKLDRMHQAVKRLRTPMKDAEAKKSKCVPVFTFTKDNQPGVSTIQFRELDSLLNPVNICRILNLNNTSSCGEL